MLLKLLKHEFIASYRTYIPVYIALYALSILIFLSYQVSQEAIAYLFIALLFLVEGAMIIFIIYNLILSLGTRVYGKPGYLLFSIPAKTSEIMISKFIANFVWIVVSVFVSFTALGIAFSILGVYEEIVFTLNQVISVIQFSSIDVFMFIVYFIVIILYYIAFFMFLFALLNLVYKGERKVLIGFLLYFGVSFIINNVISLLSLTIYDPLTGPNSFGNFWFITLIYFIVTVLLVGFSYFFMNKKMELQ